MALTVQIPKTKKKNRVAEEEQDVTYKLLQKPPAEYSDTVEQVEEIESRFRRRALRFNKTVEGKLVRELTRIVDDWKESRTGLQAKLKEWNNLFEGVTEYSAFPWDGASNMHVPIPKIKAREIRSTINRTTMRPVPFLMGRYSGPDTLLKQNRTLVKDIENFVEDKIKSGTNIHQVLKDAISPVIRDGTCPVQIIWETELERVCDYKNYEDIKEFTKDYPDADSAGISDAEWDAMYEKIADGGSMEIQFEYDSPVYDGPKAYLVPLIDFVHWPVYVTEIEAMLCHGKRVWYTDYQIEEMQRIGKFPDKECVEAVLRISSDRRDDGYTPQRDAIEGITRDDQKAKEFECFELVLKTTLDPETGKETSVPMKYLLTWAHKARRILRMEKYPIRQGKTTYFPLRLVKRDNRFLGISLIDDIAEISAEIDIHHRQRINTRTITHVPSFKAKEGAKGRFDPSRKDMQFKPGVVFWLENTEDVMQFDIRPVDLSGSVDEEMLLFQLADMVTGSSSGLSGQANPIDPRAPARKQQEQLRQSSNRIDDYVEVLLFPFSQIGQFVLDLYYQYGSNTLKYFVESRDGIIEKEIARSKFFNPNVKFKVNGTSVFVNPEQEYSRMMEIESLLANHPLVAQNARVRKESLVRVLDAGRVPDAKALTPSDEELGIVTENAFDSEGNPMPVIPAPQDREAAIKLKLQQDKMASKANESAAKRHSDAQLKILELEANASAEKAKMAQEPALNGAQGY